MKILLTGSSGFIGSALKRLLEEKRIEVISFDIKDNPLEDVRVFSALQSKILGINGIIHLAAVSRVKIAHENPLECVNTNIGGIINVLESARLICTDNIYPWVIFGSSREVYGESPTLPVNESTTRKAINVYGVSKLSGEELCKVYSENYGLKVRVLRFSNVYTGKNDHLDRVIPKFILQAFNEEDLIINGTGEEIFDFTYITDTIQGILGCVQEIESRNLLFDDFNISTGVPISLKQLADIIIKKTRSKSTVEFTKSRSYDVNKFYANPSKAKKILGFLPKITLEEGIDLSIAELKGKSS
ncbi:MAG: NAD-dependent epimerase/dehydratase family protein [Promethearchaeota archaeon]|nr:MAG: NAD-dependent epimerase/dehydratase family protein [Candidatus Lokiarchaeota archaeon]